TALTDAIREIIFTTTPTILVSGVGAGEIGRWMANKGARVIALDYNPAELLKAEAVFLKMEMIPVDKLFLRYVVAFPWQLPFINEQFDVVFHTLATPCPVSVRRLVAELLRVLTRNGRLILFWGPPTKLALPAGNEQVGRLIEPRTYCMQYTPGKVAFKIALMIEGAGKIQQREYFLREPEQPVNSLTDEDVSIIIPPPCLRRAFTLSARKRRKDSRSSPPKSISPASLINDLSLLPFILGERSAFEELSRKLRQLFRLCVPMKELSPRIDFAKRLNFWNELGWRNREQIGSELARYPFSNAFCFLPANSQAQYLKVYLFGVPRRVSRRYRLQVRINDELVEIEPALTPGWQILNLKLPALKDTKLLEIYFQQHNLFRLIDRFGIFDYRSLGVAIKSVDLV
ncbi:MAG: class I SAM-dependent methyltransferase, partial [Candidatus Sumerlaeia bacterium]|nr:class I SAM-dependent methyltransferase [Candidatus Sumerlaeia bacterium]